MTSFLAKVFQYQRNQEPASNSDVSTAQFLLEEYRDLYQNVMHLENKLFSHLSFFTTLFLGILTVSVAVVQLSSKQTTIFALQDVLPLVVLPFALLFVVGRFELRMTTELRIRKMKFIEGIARIREYFVEHDHSLADYLVLPAKLKKSPRYLRVGSQDWYQLLYLCLMNAISFLIFWAGTPYFIAFVVAKLVNEQRYVPLWFSLAWVVLGLFLTVFIFWRLSYLSVMKSCEIYDRDRERRMGGPIEYELLDQPLTESRLLWTFSDWIRYLDRRNGR